MGELTASLAHEVNQPIAVAITDANTCLRWLSPSNLIWRSARPQRESYKTEGVWTRSSTASTRFLRGVRYKGSWSIQTRLFERWYISYYSETTQFAVFVRTKLAADIPRIMEDRMQLQQVLMNLMMNSIDAMKNVDGNHELMIESQRNEDGQVLISVSDTGVGLPPRQANKVFHAFFTTKTHGAGMGLRISRSIVESHGPPLVGC
jgi:C4-dicarboxylate-specific signal transduction histidine kinase